MGGSDISTFDGAYANLSGKPTIVDTFTAPNGTDFAVNGTTVTIDRSKLSIDSTFLDGQGAAVFGTTAIQGGRIQLASQSGQNKLIFGTTSSANTLDGGGIDINAHTQQIIISDSS
jgi:hypothetical protein